MIDTVEIEPGLGLDDYASYAHLAGAVQDLRAEAAMLVPQLEGRKVWMVNSTSRGGGVAEMLPRMIGLLREVGVDIDWVTISPNEQAFFAFTKKLHNLIHGSGDPDITDDERSMYEDISRRLADEMRSRVGEDDIVVVHDPQPAGMGALLEQGEHSLHTVWRCHIGLDEDTPQTRAAWAFLEPWITTYDHAVFSAPEYIPAFLAGKSSIIAPAIDPLGDKNRPLSPHKLVGVLCNAGLMREHQPVVPPRFDHRAQRLRSDGTFVSAIEDEEVGMLFRPVVTQVSRWDRLKGWLPLLQAFALIKRHRDRIPDLDVTQRRRLDLVRLVLAGPDPASIQDDPEGVEVLEELKAAYLELEPAIQADIALISLPMDSRRENALMVNALQSCSTIVVQNSLREGFGLTATEAMWKRTSVLGSNACGLRQQIRDNLDGRLHPHPEDPHAIADVLVDMLRDAHARDDWGRSAQRRVHDEFLVFAQLRKWLRLLARAQGGNVEMPARRSNLPPDAS